MGFYSPSKVSTRVVKSLWFKNVYIIQYRVGLFGRWKDLKAHPFQFTSEPSRIRVDAVTVLFFRHKDAAQRISTAFLDESDIEYHYAQIQLYEKRNSPVVNDIHSVHTTVNPAAKLA
jgi:hypothetical protein